MRLHRFFILGWSALMTGMVSMPVLGQNPWKYEQNQTYTHAEIIAEYQKLANQHRQAFLQEYGPTDSGLPLHLFYMGKYSPEKTVLLINNAIHPGEPCGVDASLRLATELLSDSKKSKILEKVVVCIIPMYNVGGALLRDQDIRVNQNGPEEYGSRGNAQNLDLNRDFIKCDSKNARAFTKIFQEWNPDVFIDMHTTNGYDYQYALGLLNTHPDKFDPSMQGYLKEDVLPRLFENMKRKKKEITPYVYGHGKTPEDGLNTFLDSPRYSSGYTALFNTFGFISEAHKYKPYKDRVEYSYELLNSMLDWMKDEGKKIKMLRQQANDQVKVQRQFNILWKEDTTTFIDRSFKGYEVNYKKSEITGLDRMYYDRNQPFEKTVKYYNRYLPVVTITKPDYYIVPQAYSAVVDRLKWNGIEMTPLQTDSVVTTYTYFIESFETVKNPFEGHYLHYNVELRLEKQQWLYRKGDYVIKTNQAKNRYIIETLEPQGHDSYFCWNFFDNILQQKEWFSPFAFEETAAEILKDNPELKQTLEAKKKADPEFTNNHTAQLDFIFQHSKYMDRRYKRYPVGRIFLTEK